MAMRILFQGDSITDAGRSRQSDTYPACLGHGYVQLIGSRLMCDEADTVVLNRGVTGNRISDMYGRWIEDTLNIDYDILSILCGINDIGFAIRKNIGSGRERFMSIYRLMLNESLQARPTAKIVLVEPFLFKMERSSVPGNEDIVDNWDVWSGEMKARQKIIRNLAEEFHTGFVPMGTVFDRLCQSSPASRWSVDGIHLTSAGHEVLARTWLDETVRLRKDR